MTNSGGKADKRRHDISVVYYKVRFLGLRQGAEYWSFDRTLSERKQIGTDANDEFTPKFNGNRVR